MCVTLHCVNKAEGALIPWDLLYGEGAQHLIMPFDVTLQDRGFNFVVVLRMIPTEVNANREVLGCCCKRLKSSQAVLVQYRHTISGD